MNIGRALSKQLFGARYERIAKSLMASLILFLAVRTAEITVVVAPPVLFVTAMVCSAGIMWQALHSLGNTESMTGLFMLPFTNREMTFSIVLAFTGYTLITKTFLILALFFGICEWSSWQIAVSLLCACNGCFAAGAWYTMRKEKKLLPFVVLWCAAMLLSIFLVGEIVSFSFLVFLSLLAAGLRLWKIDAYEFYHPVSAKLLIRRTKGTGSIFLYLLRYLATNRNYLFNTAGLWGIAGFLPFLSGQFEGVNVMPLGFAILCLNTPVCILLSCDPDLEQAIRVLPGQAGHFCTRYCLFIFSVNMAGSSVYLMSWQMQHGGVGGIEILTACLFALQSAILSVLLEWFYPIRNWKIESDLWHHPRKYIVPLDWRQKGDYHEKYKVLSKM